LAEQGDAEAAVGSVADFGSDFDGLVVGGDGLGQLLLAAQGVAEVDVGQGGFRIDLNGLAEQAAAFS